MRVSFLRGLRRRAVVAGAVVTAAAGAANEVMLREENAAVFDTYRQQFDAVAAAAPHRPANGATVAC